MKFNSSQGRGKTSYTYRLGNEMLECSLAERDLEVLVNGTKLEKLRLDISKWFFNEKVVRNWKGLLREEVMALSFPELRKCLDDTDF